MIILFILILLLFETIAVLRGRVSPLSVFIGLWIVIFVLYLLQLYNIYSVEESTIIYLFLGICFFVFGYTISDCFRNKRIWLSGCITDISDKTDGTIMLKVIVGITIIASIPQLIERIRYVMTSGIALLSIKDSLIRGELASGSILQTVWVKPLSVIIIMLSTYFLLNDREQRFLCFGGIYFVLYDFILAGSKFVIVYFLVGIAVNAYVLGREKYYTRKLSRRVKIGIIAGIIFILVYMYSYKGGTIYKSLYYYMCGCLPMLDKVVLRESYFSNMTSCYGALSFYSIFNVVDNIISILGFSSLESITSNAVDYLALFEKSNYAGVGVQYNAFSTFMSYLYIDFGFVGSLLMSFVYGFFVHRVYMRCRENPSIANQIIICILYVYMITSMVRFQFSGYGLGLSMVYVLLSNWIRKKFHIKNAKSY